MPMKPQTTTELGTAIRAARKARGWSQTELSNAASVSRPTIARIERGTPVSTETLAKITDALDLKLGLEAKG